MKKMKKGTKKILLKVKSKAKTSKNSARAESARPAKNSVRTAKDPAKSADGAKGQKPRAHGEAGAGHFSKRAPVPVGPYPHARKVGDFIFVSGMGPRTPGGQHIPGVNMDAMGRVQSHDIAAQTHSVIQNIKNVLEDMGSGLEDVVDVTVFLTNMKQDFKTFNKVYGEYFAKIGPTRTTIEILSLPTPINVELKVIAHKP